MLALRLGAERLLSYRWEGEEWSEPARVSVPSDGEVALAMEIMLSLEPRDYDDSSIWYTLLEPRD